MIPNFFTNRTEPWRFADVITFIREHFNIKENFAFRVGNKRNNTDENQQAGLVLTYAQLMDFTFNQVKALFAEHDHFAIAIPETKQGRNILEINKIFTSLLQKGQSADVKINNFPEFFDIPKNILTLK